MGHVTYSSVLEGSDVYCVGADRVECVSSGCLQSIDSRVCAGLSAGWAVKPAPYFAPLI